MQAGTRTGRHPRRPALATTDRRRRERTRVQPLAADCPSRGLLDRIGDRWSVLVIGVLGDGPLRYSVIAGRVQGVSQKMLTQTLRALERDGLVTRTVFPEIPPHVEYEVTALGRSLREVLVPLTDWATSNMGSVQEARAEYDAR